MNRIIYVNMSFMLSGGGQLTYSNNIIIENKTIDKISRNR